MDPCNELQPEGQAAPIQDEKYFFADGDCMFLADGVIFKLHKLLLSRDTESMFRGMFSIPQGSLTQAMALDPILVDDTQDEFRALCWAVYALPTEIQLENQPGADLARLVAVAAMSHKYTLPSFETWALDMIIFHCQPGKDYLDTCSQDMLRRIFEAADKGGRQDLCTLVGKRWLPRLKTGELQLRHALDFGEMHRRREFLADVYYQQVVDMQSFAPTMGRSPATDISQSNLTPEQLHRLLVGYCSISLTWHRFRGSTVPPNAGCSNKSRHRAMLVDLLVQDPDGPLDVLRALQDAKARATASFECRCRESYIEDLISKFALSIPDHFLLGDDEESLESTVDTEVEG
ncbi:hypothetical protein DFH07DRAFT_982778 [Mycena maculata]|uniref:BTB domain-containing protein n=1 Tax=Mycena maculata TaxID=230809 RepID=A0AAD7ICU5_9AGAR|nr:hypothetical protein DFH07DRAFT_982778 [Mycena maculata]